MTLVLIILSYSTQIEASDYQYGGDIVPVATAEKGCLITSNQVK